MSRQVTTLIKALESLTARPSAGSEEYNRWIDQPDIITFLSSVETSAVGYFVLRKLGENTGAKRGSTKRK